MRSFPLEAVSRMVWDFLDREPSGVQMDGSLVENTVSRCFRQGEQVSFGIALISNL